MKDEEIKLLLKLKDLINSLISKLSIEELLKNQDLIDRYKKLIMKLNQLR